ncbi:MAG: hypothetical protein CSA95_00005, partial [Bacteroidetes bacterium]
LRNVMVGGPFMHDGRFASVDDVIDFYAHGLVWSDVIDPLMHHIAFGGNQLLPHEKEDLKAFLSTLTDSTFLTNPDFAPPERFPDGKPYEAPLPW